MKRTAFYSRVKDHEAKLNKGKPEIVITPEFIEAYKMWRSKEITAIEAMELCNLNKIAFHKRVKLYEGRLSK